MLGAVLVLSGLFAAAYGSWRGYLSGRDALVPLVRAGDPTRTLVEATQPVHVRARVRLAARHVLLAIGWLTIAMYGLYLVSAGMAVGG